MNPSIRWVNKTYYGFEGTIIAMGFFWNNKSSIYEDKLNGFIQKWRDPNGNNYAPKVADHLDNNDINVAIMLDGAKTMKSFSRKTGPEYNNNILGAANEIGGDKIALVKSLFNNEQSLGTVWLHELVYSMGYGEFGAFADQSAAGYTSLSEVMKHDYDYWTKGIDMERFGKFMENNKIID